MKTLVTTLTLAALVVASTFATAAPRKGSDLVIVNGQVVGQDPDPNIRAALTKESYPLGD